MAALVNKQAPYNDALASVVRAWEAKFVKI